MLFACRGTRILSLRRRTGGRQLPAEVVSPYLVGNARRVHAACDECGIEWGQGAEFLSGFELLDQLVEEHNMFHHASVG